MKMAILGAGAIARNMAITLCGMDDVQAYAIGARDLARAQAFADEFGFGKAYGSYEEMLQDPEIDLVYVATPHSFHFAHSMLCLHHGKHVLCEKPFMVNAKQAKEAIALAESKNLLIAEAIWTRYLPMRTMLTDLIASGIIGEVTSMAANLCHAIDHKPRLAQPELAGGALLDLGVYMVNLASAVMGDAVQEVHAVCVKSPLGVDAQNAIIITYQNGSMATLYSSSVAAGDCEGVVNGRKGYIKIDDTNNYRSFRVYDDNGKHLKTVERPAQITGFEYQVRACVQAIADGKTECPQMPHATMIRMMEQMDSIRASWDMRYPFE